MRSPSHIGWIARAGAGVALVAGAGTAAGAQVGPAAPATRALAGVVRDSADAPIARAEVVATRHGKPIASARSGDDGRFRLAAVAGGAATLEVRRLGFEPRAIALLVDTVARPLDVVLAVSPVILAGVRVNGPPSARESRLAEFRAHRAQGRFGSFFDTEEIDRLRPRHASDILRQVPGVRFAPTSRTGAAVRIRGCRPLVWVDGIRVPMAELDEVVSAGDVAALEVYNSFAGIPPQYVDRSTNCGAIVVWTRL